jgi:hypothetical protein
MNFSYEKPEAVGFKTSFVDGYEQIEIPARRNWFILPFLVFWISMWTVGGIMAITSLFNEFSLFILFWLGGWVLGWIFAAGTISWQLTGREIVRMVGQDLEVGYQLLGFYKRKLYRGTDIHQLTVDASGSLLRYTRISIPIIRGSNFGTIKFDYGAKTFRFGSGLEEAEGRVIVSKLLTKLPKSACCI